MSIKEIVKSPVNEAIFSQKESTINYHILHSFVIESENKYHLVFKIEYNIPYKIQMSIIS